MTTKETIEGLEYAKDHLTYPFDAIVTAAVGHLRKMEEALTFYSQVKRYRGANQRLDGEVDPYTPADLPYMLDVGRDHGGIARLAIGLPEKLCDDCHGEGCWVGKKLNSKCACKRCNGTGFATLPEGTK